jgi:hypothetical protein
VITVVVIAPAAIWLTVLKLTAEASEPITSVPSDQPGDLTFSTEGG